MPIAFPILPDLGAYPTSGTDAQRLAWAQLADLHARKAAVQASEAVAAANEKLAEVHTKMREDLLQAGEWKEAALDAILARWTAHDAAVDRLTAAVGAISLPAGTSTGGTADGVTAQDAETVVKIIQAVKPQA